MGARLDDDACDLCYAVPCELLNSINAFASSVVVTVIFSPETGEVNWGAGR